MLLSDSHEFIFVHNYKVAGSSTRHALRTFETPIYKRTSWLSRQLAKFGFYELPDCPTHAKAREIRSQLPERWENYFTFGFVRNPWSWQVSLYFYMLENDDHWQHDLIRSMSGFDEYIEWRVNEDKVLQSEFFCDREGNVIVDFIGRLESIQDDFRTICDTVELEAELPHRNSSSHRDYRDYYTERTRRLVANHFSEDITRFGYSFGDVRDSAPIVQG
jgi:hypothetical protein